MNDYAPFIAYSNLNKFAEYRKCVITDAPCTKDVFVGQFVRFGYFRVNCTNANSRHVIILILNQFGKYALKSPELRGLLTGIEAESIYKNGTVDEIIIIADREFIARKLMMSMLLGIRQDKLPVDYQIFPYDIFLIIVPEHCAVPKHRIMSDAEAKKLIKDQHINVANMPGIFQNDPPLAWINAHVGDLIEIERLSETTGIALFYRHVKRPVYESKK